MAKELLDSVLRCVRRYRDAGLPPATGWSMSSQFAMRQFQPSAPRAPSVRLADDPITADLRSFALEIGLKGACAMSKEELVEGLRQFHLLRHAIENATEGSKPYSAGEAL